MYKIKVRRWDYGLIRRVTYKRSSFIEAMKLADGLINGMSTIEVKVYSRDGKVLLHRPATE